MAGQGDEAAAGASVAGSPGAARQRPGAEQAGAQQAGAQERGLQQSVEQEAEAQQTRATHAEIGRASTPTSNSVQLTELSRRVAELELEITRFRTATPESVSTEAAAGGLEPLTPPYIARAVVAVEGHLADMERFAAVGNEAAAQESKVAAAMRVCTALRRLCDDNDFFQMLMEMGRLLGEADNIRLTDPDIIDDVISSGFENRPFRDLETQLLQIAGLTGALAEAHVDAAIKAYHQNRKSALERLENPMAFLVDLRALREASCLTADFLSQNVRQEQARQRWRKLLTFGLSGTLIVAANSIGTALLGPVGVAASGAIGSAAVGVAVQLV
jgi:hypothetical protein